MSFRSVRRTPRSGVRARPRADGFGCEALESRFLLATNLGDFGPGRHVVDVTAKGTFSSSGTTEFTFTTPDAAHVDVYMSFNVFEEPLPKLWMSMDDVADTVEASRGVGPQLMGADLPSGTHHLFIGSADGMDRGKTLVFNVDEAPGTGPGNDASTNVRADLGRDLGTVAASPASTFNDFVGKYDGPNIGIDPADTYLLDLPVTGTLSARLDQLAADPRGGPVSQSVTIFRDSDRDGLFESGEALATRTAVTPGVVGTASVQLGAGRYGVVVRPLVTNDPFGRLNSGSNYRLRLTFTPPDNGGNTAANATDLGTVGGATVSRTDYLSGADADDFYRFTTVAGGPFVFDGTVGGLLPGADDLVQLFDDANSNGAIDAGEVLASAETFNGSPVHLNATLQTGTYFLRLHRVAGEGPYNLSVTNRNSDLGGPATLPTNFNFNTTALGRRDISDTVSATDTEDVYRFTLERGATVSASFPDTAAGTDADMQFVLDANNDNMLGGGDELITTSGARGNAGEHVERFATAGQYFVRVLRVAGTPRYDLSLNVDYAGATTPSARPMTLSGDDASTIEFVGPGSDRVDTYRLSATGPTQLNAFLSFLADTVSFVVGPDTNRNGLIDANEALLSKTHRLGDDPREVVNLPAAGTYYVVVTSAGTVGTTYGIVFASAPVDNAGNTPASARDLGVLGTTQSVTDFVGDGSINATDDADDYYKFTLGNTGPYVFVGQLPFVSPFGSVAMQLIRPGGQVIATTVAPPNAPAPPIVTVLKDPGTYFVHVLRAGNGATYTASFAATSTDTAGNNQASTARNLGSFSGGTTTLTSGNEFVGRIDTDDLYTVKVVFFGELSATLNGATAPAFFDIQPLPAGDTIGGITDGSSRTLSVNQASTNTAQGENDRVQGLFVSPGTYAIRVHSAADTNYNLSVSFADERPFTSLVVLPASLPTSGVTIQAEDFDAGANGVAYSDNTPDNAGGAYRVGDRLQTDVDIFANPDGGFRVDNTDAGEFLNYTLFSEGNGQFDVDLRAASAGPGATFHLELDGVRVGSPSSVPVPGTGSTTSFATVTAQNIFMSQGPHLLRLVFDTRAAGTTSAGAVDSLTIRRSLSAIGTFALTPRSGTATPRGAASLAVQWTVPGRSWHDLATLDVRLRDAAGVAVWLRFYEGTNKVSLFNTRTGRFGAPKTIGRGGVIGDGHVRIRLPAVTVSAAGPDSPVVTLSLPLQFLGTHGRHFSVEVAAASDAGLIGDFVEAGTLDVP